MPIRNSDVLPLKFSNFFIPKSYLRYKKREFCLQTPLIHDQLWEFMGLWWKYIIFFLNPRFAVQNESIESKHARLTIYDFYWDSLYADLANGGPTWTRTWDWPGAPAKRRRRWASGNERARTQWARVEVKPQGTRAIEYLSRHFCRFTIDQKRKRSKSRVKTIT